MISLRDCYSPTLRIRYGEKFWEPAPGTFGPSCPCRRAWLPLPTQSGIDSGLGMTLPAEAQPQRISVGRWFLQRASCLGGLGEEGGWQVRMRAHACAECLLCLWVSLLCTQNSLGIRDQGRLPGFSLPHKLTQCQPSLNYRL